MIPRFLLLLLIISLSSSLSFFFGFIIFPGFVDSEGRFGLLGLCGSIASGSMFASKSDTYLPITPEQKRRRRGAADAKPRHSHSRENSNCGKTSSKFEWPFPRREREGFSPPRKSQRHSVDRFFESGE